MNKKNYKTEDFMYSEVYKVLLNVRFATKFSAQHDARYTWRSFTICDEIGI